jgi:hypothetical protein
MDSLIPSDQGQKLKIIAQIRDELSSKALNFAGPEHKDKFDKLRRKTKARKLTMEDIPAALKRPFEEINGDIGKLVFVYPKPGDILSKEPTLKAFAKEVGKVKLPSGKVLHAAGEPMILADLLGFLDRDGPLITFWSFLGVLIVVFVIAGSIRASITIMGTLLVGFIWMWAFMALIGLKINFFNFVAIPLMFGICVDYSANLCLRISQANLKNKDDFSKAYEHGAGAITICSLTTIIGYSVLLSAHNRAVVTFGELALLGEFSAIACALVFVPGLLKILKKSSCKP